MVVASPQELRAGWKDGGVEHLSLTRPLALALPVRVTTIGGIAIVSTVELFLPLPGATSAPEPTPSFLKAGLPLKALRSSGQCEVSTGRARRLWATRCGEQGRARTLRTCVALEEGVVGQSFP